MQSKCEKRKGGNVAVGWEEEKKADAAKKKKKKGDLQREGWG